MFSDDWSWWNPIAYPAFWVMVGVIVVRDALGGFITRVRPPK